MDLKNMERLRSGLRRTLKELQRRKVPIYDERIAVLEMQIADYDRRIAEIRKP